MKYLLIDDKLTIVSDDFTIGHQKEEGLFLLWQLQIGKIDRITVFSKISKSKVIFYRDDSKKIIKNLSGDWQIDKHLFDPYGTMKTSIREGKTYFEGIVSEYSNMVSRWCDVNDYKFPYSDKEVEEIIINSRKKKLNRI